MPDLPALRPTEVVAALHRAGFESARQRGSHHILFNPKTRRSTTVPMHGRDVPMRTLREIIRQAGMSVDEFLTLL